MLNLCKIISFSYFITPRITYYSFKISFINNRFDIVELENDVDVYVKFSVYYLYVKQVNKSEIVVYICTLNFTKQHLEIN